jgi:polysaccharide biosynthesis/export protein
MNFKPACMIAICFVSALLLALPRSGHAADPDAATTTTATTLPAGLPSTDSANGELIQLGPGDLVSVSVYGQPDMNEDVYVSNDGTISVPLLGPVSVAQLSPVEAARRVESALISHQLLVKPHVTIQIVQSHSQLVSVLGEVQKPGRYPVSPDTNVIQLLAEAGGETENGADYVYVLRNQTQGTQRLRVNLTGLADAKDALPHDMLRAGDSIYVPRAQQIFVYGEVRMPGMYRFQPGMTVMEAITLAGGIDAAGSRRRLELKRTDSRGQMQVLHVKADDLVQPGDNIRVKQSIF